MGSNRNATATGAEVGDVVRLKSGGPLMTIESVGGLICCTWFTRGGHSKRSHFDLDMLEVAAPEADVT
jgi:uncharacterized protein YodC (DUF2158 family)